MKVPNILKKTVPVAVGLVVLGYLTLYFVINQTPQWIPENLTRLARQADLLENPEAKRCFECHKEIYAAWKKSRHAIAWVSETYIEDSENRSKEKCLPCHIPRQVKNGEKPQPRLDHRDDGIYCVPCHVIDGKMHGPYDLFSPPHPTQKNLQYRESKFCGSCHEKTFEEWKIAGVEDTCQSCHMARTESRLVQKPVLSWLHSKKQVGDHSFPHGEITQEDLAVTGEISGKEFIVTLLNQKIPHRVPTADNGDPRLYLYVRFLDDSGQEVDRFKEILAPQQDTALLYGKEARFQYPLTAPVRKVEISLQYKPAWSKDKSEWRQLSYPVTGDSG